MNNIIIEKISYDTLNFNKINNANLPIEPDDIKAMSQNYTEELKKTHLDKYYRLINYPVKFEYVLLHNEIEILLSACHIGIITGRRPKLLKAELDYVEDRLTKNWIDGAYFVRFDSASPKDGMYKFPITSATDLISVLVTSRRAYNSLLNNDTKLYFVEFNDNWDQNKELRVFVCNKKVSCITQYNVYKVAYFNKFTDEQLTELCEKIIKYVEQDLMHNVCDKINITNFTADVYIGDSEIKLIEFNSFGYWLAAGSGLFNWITDKDKLYRKEDKIYLRILV